jgi:hypothetical protein
MLARVRLPQSPWRVPRSFVRFGDAGFAVLFGLALGVGILTAVGLGGIYVLLVWAAAESSLVVVLLVFATYALGRVLPTLLVALRDRGGSRMTMQTNERIQAGITRWTPASVAAALALCIGMLAAGA